MRVVRGLRDIGSVRGLCDVLGYSRQAYYKREGVTAKREQQEDAVVAAVCAIRRRQPRVGGRKLLRMMEPSGYGRDRFFRLLRERNLLVQRRRGRRRTTYAGRTYFPNLLRHKPVNRVGQVVVADITYLETEEGFSYLFLVTDYHSRKIVGWDLRRDMTSQGSVNALRQAIRQLPENTGTIHHSDRGWQYSSGEFRGLIREHGMSISMTEEDHVYENALAERVNGILKQEFYLGERMRSHAAAAKCVEQAITIYNNERLHTSIGYVTPAKKFEIN